ncbi:MAG: Rieske 2Fe-2S domain-containing protein [Crocinitomicaceae bacterium]|nr:Rieske 2Fe-2S domain-containing protein [Crocinitomicaceae bacterium]
MNDHKQVLPPFPNGWFTIELSGNLKKGQLLAREFCGQEVIIFRTESGKAVVMEAYCPHMGAHFAHGGKVEGEDVMCPFHGFCFNEKGDCTKTGYGTQPPLHAKTRVWHVKEQNGVILAYHHEDPTAEPSWDIEPFDEEGWSEPRFHEWTLNSNPQEITENSVDFGHFGLVHGYGDVKSINELKLDGPMLNAKYGMSRVASFTGIGGKTIHVEFEIFQHGLGYAIVEARAVEYDMVSRHYVMPTPINGTDIFLRIGVSVNKIIHPTKIHPLLGVIPKKILFPLIKNGYYKGYVSDVHDDFKIWKNKKYVDPPLLAAGDGPVMIYRKWAAQFHPDSWVNRNKKVEDEVIV